jgi:hypothetical protein
MARGLGARWLVVLAGVGLLTLLSRPGAPLAPCRAQPQLLPPPRQREAAPGKRQEAPPKKARDPDYVSSLPPAVGVTLGDVLRLAALGNLDIAQARLLVERARIAQQRAYVQFLPNVNEGATYIAHRGALQNTAGNVQDINRDSLFVGGGPSLTVPFSDALFGPDEVNSLYEAARFGQVRVTNDTLLAVADAYFNLLRARRRLAALDETLEYLTSEQRKRERDDLPGLLPVMRAYSDPKVGKARTIDLLRVEVDVTRFQDAHVGALRDLRAASAELVRLLHLDPSVFLLPLADYRLPLPIPGAPWFELSDEELVIQALFNRPELAENRALIDAAVARLRAAQWRPLLPSFVVNYNWGGFGGGPRIVGRTASGANILGHSGIIADFDVRGDLDVSLVWRFQNLGLGNMLQQRDEKTRTEQARVRQLQIEDRVMSQVVTSSEVVRRSREQVRLTQSALYDPRGLPEGPVYRSLRGNFERLALGDVYPLEMLDAIRRLNDVLESYGADLTEYDRWRFRLLISLGLPPQAFLDPRLMPAPPPKGGAPYPPAPPTPAVPPGRPATLPDPPAKAPVKEPTPAPPATPAAGRPTPPAGTRPPEADPLLSISRPDEGRKP